MKRVAWWALAVLGVVGGVVVAAVGVVEDFGTGPRDDGPVALIDLSQKFIQ